MDDKVSGVPFGWWWGGGAAAPRKIKSIAWILIYNSILQKCLLQLFNNAKKLCNHSENVINLSNNLYRFNMIFRWKSRENGEIYFVRNMTMWVGTQSVRNVFPNMMVQLSLQSDNCYALNSWKSGGNKYLLNIESSRMVRNSILKTIMEFNSFSAIKVILWFENELWKIHSL